MKTSSLKLPTFNDIKKELARRNYLEYVIYTHEGRYSTAPHIEFITNVIQCAMEKKKKMREGEIPTENQYIAINMPPRHSKSMTITETLPSYYLGHFPEDRVIEISYNDTFARKFGKKNKEKVKQFGSELFGIEIAKDSSAHDEWSLDNNIGGMISRGVLSGITGQGADLMIIDDPIKNREEADSETHREKIWEEWVDSFSSRLHPGAIVILILTRWHEDDLQGRLLSNKYGKPLGWQVYNFPLEAEENDILGREPGEPLWPERYGKKFIEERKRYPASFNSLYQGRPTSAEGNILKREWWQYYDRLPNIQRWILSVDANFKDEKSSLSKKKNPDTDYVSIQVWGKVNANAYLIDRVKAKLNFPATIKTIENILKKYPDISAKYIEDKANGPAIIAMLRNKVGGFIPVPAREGKVARVEAVTAWIEAGNVYLPRIDWVHDFVEECASFPKGAHDDDVDAMSMALNRLYYQYAHEPEVSEQLTPEERHKNMVTEMTGGEPDVDAFMDW